MKNLKRNLMHILGIFLMYIGFMLWFVAPKYNLVPDAFRTAFFAEAFWMLLISVGLFIITINIQLNLFITVVEL